MPGLLAALGSAAEALDAFEQSLAITQNNVANSSTAGYASQVANLNALPFDVHSSLAGGVRSGDPVSLRNENLEQSVRAAVSSLGYSQQQAVSLGSIQDNFDVTGASGIPGALNALYSSFSGWAQSANDPSARQTVLSAAAGLANSFQAAVSSLDSARSDADRRIQSTVSQINADAAQVLAYNVHRLQNPAPDPAADASVHSALESLASLVNVTAQQQPDGAFNLLIGGRTPLVLGASQLTISAHPVAAGTPGFDGPPGTALRDASGRDVTFDAAGGQLGALLDFRNRTLPGLIGGQDQQGSLNQLAQGIADRVNGLLASGHVNDGPPPVAGSALFGYNAPGSTRVAASLNLNLSSGAQLAAISPGPPYSSNGTATQLAAIAQGASPLDQINGQSFMAFYSGVAAGFGSSLSLAQSAQQTETQSLAQVHSLRAQFSGVDLNREAENLLQFQRAYEAAAKLVTVLDQLTQSTIGMLTP